MTRHAAIAAIIPLLGALSMLAGCGAKPYPVNLAYPLRSDLLVVKLPESPPEGPPAAGKLDDFVAAINQRGGKAYHPSDLSAEQRAHLQAALNDAFGSPSQPVVLGDSSTGEAAERLGLDAATLAQGSKLYRTLCLQCHGLTGDGRGPTGQWIYPLPRDFRQGVYKYVSSVGSAARKPTRADLDRNIRLGVEGTAMPPFSLLTDLEREQIVAYTIHLSLRGEVEYRVMLGILTDADDREEEIAADVRSRLKTAMARWIEADSDAIAPARAPAAESPDESLPPESVRRGYALFTDEAHGCISCHKDYGRQAHYLYDVWGGSSRAADLTQAVGARRGGKTPVDLFHRIRGGIGAAGMPAATSLTDEQVWDLVHFVQALPYSKMLPDDVRRVIYHTP